MHRPTVADNLVVARWREQCAGYDKDMRKSLIGASIAAVVLALGAALLGADFAVIVPLLCAGLLMWFCVLRVFLASTLMCPKCNDPPQPIGQTTHPRRARSCDECGCALAP